MKSLSDRFSHVRLKVADTSEAVVTITFVILFIFFAFYAKDFLSAYAISNFLTFGAVYGVTVIGVAFLMISGEFDLSVGSTMAVAMYIVILALLAHIPALLAVLLALLVSVILGLINGLIVVNSKIPSYIVTLGSMLAYRGLARFLGNGRLINYTVPDKPELFNYLNGNLTAINDWFQPAGNLRAGIFWFAGLMLLMTFVLFRTRFGNWTFATGGSPGAAISQGVNVGRVKLVCFMLCGLMAGFAGMLFFSHRFSVNPLSGSGGELVAVAASVIGGVRLNGGYGTIVGACVGIILMSMLQQALASMGVAQEIFEAVTGLIIIVSVLANTLIGREE